MAVEAPSGLRGQTALILVGALLLVAGVVLYVSGWEQPLRAETAWAQGVAALVLAGVGGLLLIGALLADLPRRARAGPEALAQLGSARLIVLSTAFVVLAGNLVAATLFVIALPPVRRVDGFFPFLVAAVATDLVVFGFVYLVLVRTGVFTVRTLGIEPALLPRNLALGVAAGPLLWIVAGLVEAALRALGVEQTQAAQFAWLQGVEPWQFGVVLLLAAVVAPTAEELYFRGYVFPAVYARYGPLAAYVGSSLLFSLLHLNLEAVLPIAALGATLAWLYRTTGSIVVPIVAHGVNNAVAVSALYFGMVNV